MSVVGKKKKENYLDYIPAKAPGLVWHKNSRGRVTLEIANKGLFNRVAQTVFGRPEKSYIEMDDYGSYLWERINGKRDIYTLGIMMQKHFGDRAEPLYERLSKFISILKEQHYIVFEKAKNEE